MPPGKSFKSLLIASLWLTDLKTKEKILGVQVWGRRAPLEGWRSNTWTTHPTPLPQARLSWPQGETWGDKILLYFRYVEPKKLKLKNITQRRVGGTGENDQKEQNSSYRIIKSWGCKVKKKKGENSAYQKTLIPGKVTTEGNGTRLLYSCLENPTDGGAWQAAIYGVAQSWTRLKRLSSSSREGDKAELPSSFIKEH